MPYIDDLVSSGKKDHETFDSEIGNIQFVSHEVASISFPGVKLNKSPNICYFPFKLCHSLPTRNRRGRAFTNKVLASSFASLNDQLIDLDHSLEANGIGSDKIVGFVKATKFELPKDANEVASEKPNPVLGLGVLFLRATGIKEIVESHVNKESKWSVSMECGHFWKDAYLKYRDEFIPLPDAEVAMKDCIGPDYVKAYRGNELTVCLGGLDKQVDFWGTAITENPADGNANIFSFIGGRGDELASKKIFYMPLRKFSNLELANTTVDKKIIELGSIGIIGETEPASDGHSHYILSDLTLYASEVDHNHGFRNFNISRGSNPSLTGITSEHTEYVSSGNSSESRSAESHSHLVNVPLRGKFKDSVDPEETDTSVLSMLSMMNEGASMNELQKLLKKMDEAIDRLVNAKDDKAKETANVEVASLRKDIAKLENERASEDDKKKFVEEKIASGDVIAKEEFEKKLKEAEDKAAQKYKADLEAEKTRQARIQKCTDAGINLDTEFDGIKDKDGNPMTFRKKLESIPVEDDNSFSMDYMAWSKIFEKEKKDKEKEAAELQKQETEQKKKDAANAGGKKNPVLALAGGGKSATEENEIEIETATSEIPKHLRGRSLLKSK